LDRLDLIFVLDMFDPGKRNPEFFRLSTMFVSIGSIKYTAFNLKFLQKAAQQERHTSKDDGSI